MMRHLLPIRALVRRELLSVLRMRRSYAFMALAICVLSGAGILSWPRSGLVLRVSATWSTYYTLRMLQILFFGSALFIPALSGHSVVSERDSRTFEMLAMTHARPWQFVMAKLMNSVGYYMLLAVAALPILDAHDKSLAAPKNTYNPLQLLTLDEISP